MNNTLMRIIYNISIFTSVLALGIFSVLFTKQISAQNLYISKSSDELINPVEPLCSNSTTIQLTATPSGGYWSGTGITDESRGFFNPSKAVIGNNLIVYTVEDNGELLQDSIIVVVNPAPEINLTRFPFTGCAPLEVYFDNITENTDYFYLWEFQNPNSTQNLVSTLKKTSQVYSLPGIYEVKLVVTTIESCIDSVKTKITIHAPPTADFKTFPSKAGLFNPLIQFEDASIGALVWEWDFGDGSKSNNRHPSHLYRSPGEFDVKLKILSDFLCADTVIKKVTIVEDHKIYFPSAINLRSFENSEFYPQGSGIDEDYYELTIYGRFGDIIFTTKDFNQAWQGRYNNNKGDFVAQGTYSYVAKLRDKKGTFHEYSGHVTVIK